jgi:glucose-6-phosphate 1-dehydrogenase
MVIFGAGGDLTKRKLIPALYHLASQGLLSERFSMLGVDRVAQDSEGYRETLDHGIREFLGEEFEQGLWDSVLPRAYYMPGDFQDPQTYVRLKELLGQVKAEQGNSADVLFYLATPPRFFGEIAKRLGEAGLAQESDTAWRRIIIEKPFGHDLASARALNHELHQHFQEHQVYRIDHYLGKETVQNIMAYRFGNATVEPIWNRNYIDHVQITVAESLGVENRASYYEQAGALRDMVPNHMLSVLSIVAMEPSNSFDADAIRDEQAKVLRAIQPLTPEQVLSCAVRGQYGAGVMPGGEQVPAYRDEPGIARDSNTVTFAALKLQIDTWRWAGVPFYLRTGKRMPKRYTEVVVQYRHAPNMLFRESLVKRFNLPANMLLLSIQPKEGISLCFNAKVPGPEPRLGTVEMDFRYEDYFGNAPSTGYETLIHDCLTGDATLFKRADSIELGWEVVDPVLDVWDALAPRDFPNYPAGSPGPPAAEELLARDGRRWRTCPS